MINFIEFYTRPTLPRKQVSIFWKKLSPNHYGPVFLGAAKVRITCQNQGLPMAENDNAFLFDKVARSLDFMRSYFAKVKI